LTGTATRFDLRYSTSPITDANFNSATSWSAPPTPGISGTHETVTIIDLQPSTQYWFALKTVDDADNWSGISNVITKTTLAAPDLMRPSQIANLTATSNSENTAVLNWTAVGDDSLTGTATSYDIRYSTTAITAANFASATQVTNEPTPGASGAAQTFTVGGLSRQRTYYFAIKAIDEAGNPSAVSNVATATTLDKTRPAAVNDLAVGFIWIGASPSASLATLPSGRERGRYRL
jgi:chitodextrinase